MKKEQENGKAMAIRLDWCERIIVDVAAPSPPSPFLSTENPPTFGANMFIELACLVNNCWSECCLDQGEERHDDGLIRPSGNE